MAIRKQLGALALSAMMAGSTMVPAGNALAQKSQVKDLNTQPTTTMVEKVSNEENEPQDGAQLRKLTPSQLYMYESQVYAELQALNVDPEDAATLKKLTPAQFNMYQSELYKELQAMNLPSVEAQDGASLNSYTPEELAKYYSDMNESNQGQVAKIPKKK